MKLLLYPRIIINLHIFFLSPRYINEKNRAASTPGNEIENSKKPALYLIATKKSMAINIIIKKIFIDVIIILKA